MAGRWKRKVGIGVLMIAVLLAIGITFTVGWRPVIGPKSRALTSVTFESTPARMERGRYLVEGVVGCFDCHSPHKEPGGPIVEDQRGAGQIFAEGGDFPGRCVAPNITPDKETGAGNWTDDMLARAIREGIGHDGRALFPIMPYGKFREMSDEDLASVIVYVRAAAPVRSQLPKTAIKFPLNRLINNAPQPILAPVPQPDLSEPVKRGAYMTALGACADCHTPQDKGQPIAGLDMAGGAVFGDVAAANITPDATGISYYDEALFVQAIRTGFVRARKLSYAMPWLVYRNMSDEDLKAIFAYTRTLAPVKHRVDNSEPPTKCKLCHLTHGGGEKN